MEDMRQRENKVSKFKKGKMKQRINEVELERMNMKLADCRLPEQKGCRNSERKKKTGSQIMSMNSYEGIFLYLCPMCPLNHYTTTIAVDQE